MRVGVVAPPWFCIALVTPSGPLCFCLIFIRVSCAMFIRYSFSFSSEIVIVLYCIVLYASGDPEYHDTLT